MKVWLVLLALVLAFAPFASPALVLNGMIFRQDAPTTAYYILSQSNSLLANAILTSGFTVNLIPRIDVNGTLILGNDTNYWHSINAENVTGGDLSASDLLCLRSDCRSAWPASAVADDGNHSIQFNYNNAFKGDSGLLYYYDSARLVATSNGSFGYNLVVNGTNGNTSFTGNNVEFSRPGPNYITALDAASTLYLGAGGTAGVIGISNAALVNSIWVNQYGVGILTVPNSAYTFNVLGVIHASDNMTSPLLNTSCISLSGDRICNWTAVNGSIGGETHNGTFNETQGTYVYNDTAFTVKFNDTLNNLTIDARANTTSQQSDLSNLWLNASAQSGDIQSVNDSAVHKFGDESAAGAKNWTGNAIFYGSEFNETGNASFANNSAGTPALRLFNSPPLANTRLVANNGFALGVSYSEFYGITPMAWIYAASDNKGVQLYTYKSGGSYSSPSAVQYGWNLNNFEAKGYGATGWSSAGRAGYSMYAAENWTDTAQGTGFNLRTTPNGTASARTVIGMNESGIINEPYQSGVRAYNSSASYGLPTTLSLLAFDMETYDAQSEFDTAASRFTAHEAGRYSVSAGFNCSAGAIEEIVIEVNGVINSSRTGGNRGDSAQIVDGVMLASGGYIEIWARSSIAGTACSGGVYSTLSISKVA